MKEKTSQGELISDLDPSWKGLFRLGGISAALFVVLIATAIVLSIITPQPPASGGVATLKYIASHRSVYVLEQQLWLVPGLFAMIVYLALYIALRHLSKSYATLGAVIGGVAWALTLAIPTTSTGAPALVYLSDQYMSATTAVQRASFASAAETLIAQNNTVTAVGILTTIGLLIISLVMLKGVFHKGVAYLGIVAGAIGIASEALRVVLPSIYGIYGILMLIWFAAVGWKLYRLS